MNNKRTLPEALKRLLIIGFVVSVIFILIAGAQCLSSEGDSKEIIKEISQSQFMDDVESEKVASVVIKDKKDISGE